MEIDFIDTKKHFDALCSAVQGCNLCPRMAASQRVLNYSSGALDATVMFIGEAPGRLGADSSGIPFHGDKSGHNFEELLDFANIDRAKIFVTNSVLCNPRDHIGNNATPTKAEIFNCSTNLAQQILTINPKVVVTLGAVALEGTRHVQYHSLTLKSSVRTANSWFDRILIPLYHPGQRAMLHRSFSNQRSDYQFVSEQLIRSERPLKQPKFNGRFNESIALIIREILDNITVVDYFQLHKLFYLLEYNYNLRFNNRLTNAYIVRQKDGPYCTDLHIQKIKKALPDIQIKEKNGRLLLSMNSTLFSDRNIVVDTDTRKLVREIVLKYGTLTNAEIKTKVYLTSPMRKFLKLEKEGGLNLYNVPIVF